MTREEQKIKREQKEAEAKRLREEAAEDRRSKFAFIRMIKMCKEKGALVSYSGVQID